MIIRQTIALILTIAIGSSGQTIHVVNNNPNAPTGAHVFATLQEALDAALPGDIVHVVPSKTPHGRALINKRLTIYGGGGVRDFDFETPSHPLSWIDAIGFTSGNASGTTLSGLNVRHFGFENEATYSDLCIERCRIGIFANDEEVLLGRSSTLYALQIANLTIANSVINQIDFGSRDEYGALRNVVISNNAFPMTADQPSVSFFPYGVKDVFTPAKTANMLIANNVFFAETNAATRPNAIDVIDARVA